MTLTKTRRAVVATMLAASAAVCASATATAAPASGTADEGVHAAACAPRPGPEYVAGDGVRLRSGPGTGYRILGAYNCGQQVSVHCFATPNEWPGWWYLTIVNGPTGYMRADYVANTGMIGVCR